MSGFQQIPKQRAENQYVVSKYRYILTVIIILNLTGVDPAQVTVRNLKLEQFTFSPQTGAFELNVTWQKPVFNYSNITAYEISYQVNEGNVTSTNTVSILLTFINPSTN